MLQFAEPVPQEYLTEYRLLSAELDRQLPPKALDTNLLVASWNLRAFGEYSDVWVAGSGVSPNAISNPCCASPRSSRVSMWWLCRRCAAT